MVECEGRCRADIHTVLNYYILVVGFVAVGNYFGVN